MPFLSWWSKQSRLTMIQFKDFASRVVSSLCSVRLHRWTDWPCIEGAQTKFMQTQTDNALTLQFTSMPQLPRDSIGCRVVHTRSVDSTAHWFSPSSLNLQRSKRFKAMCQSCVTQEPGPGLMTFQAPLACTDKGLWYPRSWQTSQPTSLVFAPSVTKTYKNHMMVYIAVCLIFLYVFHIQVVTHFKKHPRSTYVYLQHKRLFVLDFWVWGQFSYFCLMYLIWCCFMSFVD